MQYFSKAKSWCMDSGLFLIRIALAAVFITHGVGKAMAVAKTTAFFASLGLGPFFVYLVIAVEILGGAAMLLGVWTKIAGLLLAVLMLMAIWLVKFKMGFVGGYEFELTLMLVSLGIALAGPGRFSLAGDSDSKKPMESQK